MGNVQKILAKMKNIFQTKKKNKYDFAGSSCLFWGVVLSLARVTLKYVYDKKKRENHFTLDFCHRFLVFLSRYVSCYVSFKVLILTLDLKIRSIYPSMLFEIFDLYWLYLFLIGAYLD